MCNGVCVCVLSTIHFCLENFKLTLVFAGEINAKKYEIKIVGVIIITYEIILNF